MRRTTSRSDLPAPTPLQLDDAGRMTEQLAPSKAEAELALYCACEILK